MPAHLVIQSRRIAVAATGNSRGQDSVMLAGPDLISAAFTHYWHAAVATVRSETTVASPVTVDRVTVNGKPDPSTTA
ncbi:MAG TPA: hypothetical protein DCP63_00345 [Bacteroidetes bacterium]|nr:hypothetical protein [Bacteroidota bacterium]